ncbi:endonuclease/Exonuclease/phosphatase family domain-containing protein [Ditylenchus destructor]|uniref:Endonuclease/Exonuclease/phosphatase family domain-containing protein n=1 Tax=Ditylenchus destructor TaxID=166010 RepID=A0AAD4MYI9_9BILA|nr:endonuclease/Exonuclease/phosphatase family domain-containing protein [Ditylenchus destructor]
MLIVMSSKLVLFVTWLFVTYTVGITATDTVECSCSTSSTPKPKPHSLRIMTFNTWKSGAKVDYGMSKIVRQIINVNPDIAALQEITDPARLVQIVDELKNKTGVHWEGKVTQENNPNVAILSKYKILNVLARKSVMYIASDIAVSRDLNISFWAHWNHYQHDGPVEVYKKTIVDNETMLKNEEPRLNVIKELVAEPEFQKALKTVKQKPILVCGDFNCPSHQDWIYENRHLHFNKVLPWPTTKYLTDHVKMTDSYRKVHPNVTVSPGITWSTVETWNTEIQAPEPHNRIDFIFYKGSRLTPVRSETMPFANGTWSSCDKHCQCGETCDAVKNNVHPSDHFLVYTDFEWR